MSKKFLNMNDEELDKLFRDAAQRFLPPDAPEDAWDVFYKTKMFPSAKNIEKRSGWAILTGVLGRFFIPKPSWQFAVTCCLFVIASLFLFNRKTPSGEIAGHLSGEIGTQPITRNGAPSSSGVAPAADSSPLTGADHLPGLNAGEQTLSALLSEKQAAPFALAAGAPAPFDFSKKPAGATRPFPADSADPQHKMNFSLREKTREEQSAKPTLPDHYRPSQMEGTASRRAVSSQWQVGLLAGSNLGMVRGDVSKKPGLNAGVLVQRKLGQSRFSLESGVVYESMTYAVNNEDFNPNGQPVSSRVSNIEGTCSMIDVPVNVRYDVVASKKNRAFVSTGVSPTVIVKQSYVYDFDRGEGPVPVTRDVSGRGKSVYAVANLSVGFEQKWEHVSVQIAPYVKIPMGEIGYGNLSLGGVGTQISIKKSL